MRAVHTPGHTPGHLCFAEENTRLFFSGDHVLPRISPNISTNHRGLADPLQDYLDSLAAVRDLDPAEVLPAHEWRFRGLDDRVDSLTAHHEHRLTELLTAIRTHPHSTPWDAGRPPHLVAARGSSTSGGCGSSRSPRPTPTCGCWPAAGLVTSSGGPVPTWTLALR